MPSLRPHGRRGWAIAVSAPLAILVAGAVAFVLLHEPRNVSHPQISFTAPSTTTPTPKPRRARKQAFLWPIYGLTDTRTRDFAGTSSLHPPFRTAWTFGGNALIEFPPDIDGNTLYFMDDGATAKAVSTTTGRQLWKTHLGTLSAASPGLAVRQHLLIVPTLSTHGTSPGGGEIAALSMRTGRVLWRHPVPSGSESSPIVRGHTVYLGDQAGTVFAMNVTTGHVEWTYQASGAVKGGLALSGQNLYFGDYAGRVYDLRASDGHAIWTASTSGSEFGFGSGNFYSTPAVAFGRVYLGNTDGFVYSFSASTGQLAWSVSTGAYVYASPAVADVPGLGPTVYMGSYNGQFYAFDARSGAIRWAHHAGGRISGSATIVDGVVYYSDLNSRTTTGLNARTGRVEFSYPDGEFTPIVADDSALYLSGYDHLYKLVPREPKRTPPRRHRSSKHVRHHSRSAHHRRKHSSHHRRHR